MPDLYRSPQKAAVRRQLWLPSVRNALADARAGGRESIRYMTLCGPQAYDVRLFVRNKLLQPQDVVAWETKTAEVAAIKARFPTLDVVEGNLFTLSTRPPSWLRRFPFDVLNLDFTGRSFSKEDVEWPDPLLVVRTVCEVQRQEKPQFRLFLTCNGTFPTGCRRCRESVTSVLEYAAVRLGEPAPLFRVTRDGLEHDYHQTLLQVIPLVVIRTGFDAGYDVECSGKSWYVPWRTQAHPPMVSMVFSLVRHDAPLSESSFSAANRLENKMAARQFHALSLPVTAI